jgi:hypothetical protein
LGQELPIKDLLVVLHLARLETMALVAVVVLGKLVKPQLLLQAAETVETVLLLQSLGHR